MVTWSISGDVPVTGDFDGDGISDFTVYRSGTWNTQFATDGYAFVAWGTAGDRAAGRVPGS